MASAPQTLSKDINQSRTSMFAWISDQCGSSAGSQVVPRLVLAETNHHFSFP